MDGTPRYRVLVDDNYHYMDAGERYELGAFATCEQAVVACRHVVDQFLQAHYQPPMTPADLWQVYAGFGEDPFISTTDPACAFSAWQHARARC